MSVTIVGILNLTPDSFSDAGKFVEPEKALAQARKLLADGAQVVDIGAEATNPWAAPISVELEWQRLEPVVSELLPNFAPGTFSIDTRHPEIVERAAAYGRFYVNDVTTFIDPAMIEMTARFRLPAIASHLPLEARGDIARAHAGIKLDSAGQVRDELLERRDSMIAGGIAVETIILDPGIGFGKSMRLNWELLEFAKLVPGEWVMVGPSRKRFLACDPLTGEPVDGRDKLDPELNLKAARISAASAQDIWLRVHEPALYKAI
jgi:dihydropteroate synthase